MPSRRDVEQLRSDVERITSSAADDLEHLVGALDYSDPAAARDQLLELMPGLVDQYEQAAEAYAAAWYEQMHPDAGYQARMGNRDVPRAAIEENIRFHAGSLFNDDGVPDPSAMYDGLVGSMQRHVAYGARWTIARNASLDPREPRYARVPAGTDTCAFCEMLASRGWVYHDQASAGDSARNGFGDDFHDACQCQIVPSWDRDRVHLEGYDPDAMYERYRAARRVSDSGDAADITATMRQIYPLRYTDGAGERHRNPSPTAGFDRNGITAWTDWRNTLIREAAARGDLDSMMPPTAPLPVPERWDNPRNVSLREREWNHLLFGYGGGGGHLNGYGATHQFPDDWGPSQITEAISTVLRDNPTFPVNAAGAFAVSTYQDVQVGVAIGQKRSQPLMVRSAFPVDAESR